MKIAAFVLLISAGSLGICQSAEKPGPPTPPEKHFTVPPASPWHFGQRGFEWNPPEFDPTGALLKAPRGLSANANVDPKIAIHPPLSSVGTLAPGTPVAQNLYPKLEVLPIGLGMVAPLSTQWPVFRLENIPITWPKLNMGPAAQSSALPKITVPSK